MQDWSPHISSARLRLSLQAIQFAFTVIPRADDVHLSPERPAEPLVDFHLRQSVIKSRAVIW
jgi:hypothetical protein